MKTVVWRITLFLTVCILFVSSFTVPSLYAQADTTGYTDVISDLQTDETFDLSDYPSNAHDYSVSLETIAESSDGELFVYCYIPYIDKSGLEATSINISMGTGDNLSYKNYKLTLLSKAGTMSKYLVNDFSVKNDAVRFYSISAIYRKWYQDIDGNTTSNVITEKAFPVGREYTAVTTNGKVIYSCHEEEIINITDKLCGTIRYKDGVSGIWSQTAYSTDSHFVAFSTDHDIDKLIEVDLQYSYITYTVSGSAFALLWSDPEFEYGDPVTGNTVTLTYTDKATNLQNGKFSKTYEWNRIQTGAEFAEDTGDYMFSESTVEEIRAKDWVLRFLETESMVTYNPLLGIAMQYKGEGIFVRNVIILRLKFETEEKVYNLGVVDNMQSGGVVGSTVKNPIEAVTDVWSNFWEGMKSGLNNAANTFKIIGTIILVVFVICLVVWIIDKIIPHRK